MPAKPLAAMLREPRVLLFGGLWLGLNWLLGLPLFAMPGVEIAVAWQAHIGGFLGGLLAFGVFDPVPALPESGPGRDAPSIDDETASS